MSRIRPIAARRSLALGVALALMVTSAWGYWGPGAGSGGDGASSAATLAQGSTPTAVATGDSVAVSWTASNVIVGHPVTGYLVKRFEASTLTAATVKTNCDGTVSTTSCTENSVPSGQWRYSVTPKLGTFWSGPESLMSSAVTTLDPTPPANVITANTVSGNAFKSAGTLFYRGIAAGSFTVTNAVTDSGSGPASSTTAALGGTPTGWTHVPSTVSTPSGGPYVSNAFSWTSATTTAPTEVVTGRNGAGSAAATTLTYVNDSTAPSGGSVAYTDGYQPYQAVSVTFSAGTDSGSGIVTHRLQRSSAAISGGVCGTFTGFTNVVVDSAASPFNDNTVANQNCYQYRYVVTDQVGNQSISTSANVAKVDTSAGGPAPGFASTFSVLGGTSVTSSGDTVVSGDLAVSPGTSVVGFPPGFVGGSIHAGDAAAGAAQSSLHAAYNDAAARAPTDTFSGDLGGLTLNAGVHHAAGAVTLTGTLTLDGQGDPNSVFIFQLGAAFATAAASHVTLIDGATTSHVFWQVTGAVGTGASSVFAGTIMATGAVTIGDGAQLLGRVLGFDTITLSDNSVRFGAGAAPTLMIAGGLADETLDTTPTISGTTDAGTGQILTVTIGGQSLPTSVANDGSWSVTAAELAAGNYTIIVTVRNLAGDQATARQNMTVAESFMGALEPYSVLGGTAVSSTGATTLSGDLGVSPATSVTGFPPGTLEGDIHAGDSSAATAHSKLVSNYNIIRGDPPTDSFAGEMGGLTLGAGLHHGSGAISLTGTLTLDAAGDPNAYFVFQLDSTLATAAASHVTLINGAQPEHVGWQVDGAVGIGASSFFVGTIMAAGAVTLGANAQVIGRALGLGTVTMSANTIRFGTALPPTVTITGGLAVQTYDSTPDISGTTNAGTGGTVTVAIGGQSLYTSAASDGSWSVTAAELAGGNYTAVATARNAAGDGGSARQNVTVNEPILGALAPYSVLAGTAVSSSGATVVSGDLGVSPSSTVVGFPPGTVGGSFHAGDDNAAAAHSKLVTDYNTISNEPPNDSFSGEIGATTFGAGVHYGSGAISLTGTVTLDAQGDPDAYFLFQLSAALATAAASHVTLINGAQISNVFWQVNGAVGMGASSSFVGTIMASGAITLGANAQLLGRALGFDTVTLSSSTIRFTSALPPTVTINGGSSAITASTTPTITGTTTAGVGRTVTVRVEGQTLSATVQSDTSWSVTTTALAGGPHQVVASARDAAGNAGSATQTLTVELNPVPPALGAVSTYSVFGGSGVSSSGSTALSGDLGSAAGGGIAGFPPGTFGGSMHTGDSAATAAQSAMVSAYNDAASRTPTDSFAGEIGGLTFNNGVHHAAAAISLTGTVTLDGRGDPDARFIFQVNAAMATAAASHVVLINGAQASNVFWQISGAFGTGASAVFVGTIMSAGAITLGAGATLSGRALSYGLVTLSTNTVTTS
jgi:hypothetical protein